MHKNIHVLLSRNWMQATENNQNFSEFFSASSSDRRSHRIKRLKSLCLLFGWLDTTRSKKWNHQSFFRFSAYKVYIVFSFVSTAPRHFWDRVERDQKKNYDSSFFFSLLYFIIVSNLSKHSFTNWFIIPMI